MLIVDVHRTAAVAELEPDKSFYDTLMDIRTRYCDLLAFPLEAKKSLASFTDLDSRAACRVGQTCLPPYATTANTSDSLRITYSLPSISISVPEYLP